MVVGDESRNEVGFVSLEDDIAACRSVDSEFAS